MDKKLKDALNDGLVSRQTMRESLGIVPILPPAEDRSPLPSGAGIDAQSWIPDQIWKQLNTSGYPYGSTPMVQPLAPSYDGIKRQLESEWYAPGSLEWYAQVGQKAASTPTGGTYETRRYNPDRDAFDVTSFDHTGKPIWYEEEPMKQLDVIKPSSPRAQAAGAKVLDYSDSYMVEVHDHNLLLQRYHDIVGRRRKIDTLVGIGISGSIAVVNLARDLGIDYLILRKDGVSAHSSWPAEGRLGKNWLFVDDIVSSGATFAGVWDKMANIQKQTGFTSTFKGMFLYASPKARWVTEKYDQEQFHWWLEGRSEHYNNEFKQRSIAW